MHGQPVKGCRLLSLSLGVRHLKDFAVFCFVRIDHSCHKGQSLSATHTDSVSAGLDAGQNKTFEDHFLCSINVRTMEYPAIPRNLTIWQFEEV